MAVSAIEFIDTNRRRIGASEFRRRWFFLNAAAFSLGYIVDTPIAHGITGKHAGLALSWPQLAAHAIALVVVALLVGAAQRRALTPFIHVTWFRVIVGALAANLAFWFGWYQPWVNPFFPRFLLCSLVLGSWAWIGSLPSAGHRVAAGVAIISFPLATFVGIDLFFIAAAVIHVPPALETSDVQHAVFFTLYGVVTGVLGGWLSGHALSRLLPD